ncbi:SDR family NAD(P)-dependent oxidoreductase [Kitasatospora sp. NPDC059747]|uniref:SDR family NAD(P)-dependent oxidoreductase n=1 Tax=Kitasatospora sp. NPDC059747 TaxID=3346930 RepID=UPI00365CE6C6
MMRTILITGATSGLGYALAHRCAEDGVHLILHGRDPLRLASTAKSVQTGHSDVRVTTVTADLSELHQVREMADQIREINNQLDVLVNNAGIGFGKPEGSERRVTADGVELRFAVNYLAGFLLTIELLPLLRRTRGARVVNVASIGQQAIDFDDLMIERGYSGIRAYSQSKLAQIMMAMELGERLPAAEVTFNSVHPASYMPTKMVLLELGTHVDSLDEGVASVYRLVSDPELATVTGKFFDRTAPAEVDPQAYERAARHELLRQSLRLIGNCHSTRDSIEPLDI